jgi:PAS domain S-box-containing protein
MVIGKRTFTHPLPFPIKNQRLQRLKIPESLRICSYVLELFNIGLLRCIVKGWEKAMNETRNIYRDLYLLTATLAVVFTLLIAVSLAWNIHHEHQEALQLAKREALATFNKDQAFRLWIVKQGGGYVPATSATEPSPYLSHIPERDVFTPSNRHLTLMNSAYVMRKVMEEYFSLYGVKGHITSMKPLNPDNFPDEWEQEALKSFEQGAGEALTLTELDGKAVLRLMHPMMTSQECLKCHAIQGYKVGEVRGGVGITVPLAPYLAIEKKAQRILGLSHGVIWMLGMTGIGLGFARGRKNIDILTLSRENIRRKEQRLARLNRLSSVLNRINETIIRTSDPEKLYDKTCRIATDTGGFRMAWFGKVDPGTLAVLPVAHCGPDDGYLEMLRVSINPDIPEGRGPTGTALREKKSFINNDTANNPLMYPWRDDALKRGYLSSASFPLVCGEACVGALTFYADETDFFQEEEVRLLSSLADDISLAMVSMENEAKRYQAEIKVEQQFMFLQKLIDTIPSPIFYKDADGKYLGCNACFEAVLGKTKDSIVGSTVYEVNPHDIAEIHDRVDRELFCHQGTRQYEALIQYADGNLHNVLMHKATFLDQNGEVAGLVGVMMDITERKSLESQLRQAQKIEAIGTLASGIAHDFNNILTAIIGFSSLIEMKLPEKDPMLADVSQITSAAERATDLTRSLLAFCRKQVIDTKPVDLNRVIGGMEKMLRRLITEDVILTVSPSAESLPIMADARQIEQIIMNLTVNARDAMPAGGAIAITTETITLDEEFCSFHGFGIPGRYALLLFADTGNGMEETTRQRIFEPFFTTKEVGKGTGLGLSVCYGIIKQHKGYINCYSEPGRGTTFRIYLPLLDEMPESDDTLATVPVTGGTETVLLAEDDPATRSVVKTFLEQFGYHVIEAEDGEEAVNKFKEKQAEIQLCLLDMIMPRKKGIEALREINLMEPKVRAILMSGYQMDASRNGELKSEGADFIAKPILPKELLRKVREMLDRK